MNHKRIGTIIQLLFAAYIVFRVVLTLRRIITMTKIPKVNVFKDIDTSKGILHGIFSSVASDNGGVK